MSHRKDYLSHPSFSQIDIIGVIVIVWRVRGKIIRSVLCSIVRLYGIAVFVLKGDVKLHCKNLPTPKLSNAN